MARPRLKLITLPWELEVPTLSLASLAAVTPRQFDIALVDVLRERLVVDEPTDLVGISASTPTINAAYALADLYRQRGAVVVLGGHHVTAMPDEGLQHADAVVCGEGETSWARLCDDFLTEPSRVHGVYRDPAPDLATLPLPRVDLLKVERYGAFYYPVIASRGCPEACTFCFAKRMTLGYRTYPLAHVQAQVRARPASVQALYFVDDNLPADPDYSRELFAMLAKEGVPFGMQARVEFCRDEANLRAAREAGCALISSGYESVNQPSLDSNAKRAVATEYRELIANVFRAGIITSGNWMFGFDDDTPDVFERTIEFLDTTDLMHASFTTEIPFPGTAIWRRYKLEGRLLTEDYDEYVGKDHVVVRPRRMSPRELQRGIRHVAKAFYSPRRAARRFRKALDNHALHGVGPALLRGPALLALNAFQVWQWHYRMVPALQGVYQHLLRAWRYRWPGELWRRTNFEPRARQRPPKGYEPGAATGSAFTTGSAFKPSRVAPLSLHKGPAPHPPRP